MMRMMHSSRIWVLCNCLCFFSSASLGWGVLVCLCPRDHIDLSSPLALTVVSHKVKLLSSVLPGLSGRNKMDNPIFIARMFRMHNVRGDGSGERELHRAGGGGATQGDKRCGAVGMRPREHNNILICPPMVVVCFASYGDISRYRFITCLY